MRTSHALLVAAIAGFLLGACGPTPTTECSSKNCTGCCDSAGQCQLGVTVAACGVSGAACTACSGFTNVCRAGLCATDSVTTGGGGGATGGGGGTTCSAATCGGCCASNGVCQPGVTSVACGTNGASCLACGAGEACTTAGVCQATGGGAGGGGVTGGGSGGGGGGGGITGGGSGGGVTGGGSGGGITGGGSGGGITGGGSGGGGGSVGCTPSNCGGCCAANGVCQPGVSINACGANGTSCIACSASQVCTTLGQCQAAGGGAGGGGGAVTGGGGGSVTGGGAGGGSATGTCTNPTPIVFVNDTFESTGFLVGNNGTSTSCMNTPAAGPELVFSATTTAPAYFFAVQTGNATSAPGLKLQTTCAATPTVCAATTTAGQLVGFQSNALAAGTWLFVADSQAGNGGNYGLVVSKSTTLGDACSDARVITMGSATRAVVAGDTSIFNATFASTCQNGTTALADALFQFIAPRSGMLTVTVTPDVGFDVNLSVRAGAVCASATEAGCSDTGNRGQPDTVTANVTLGNTYWVRVGGYSANEVGAYKLELMLP